MDKKSQAKRILANVVDFDMHNLFPPATFTENLEEAAAGEFTTQPKKTVRERPFGNQPLMIAPKYKGDFLEKLRKQPLKGKPVMYDENAVDVYAANSDNLWDFSMPSEWLKHQEQPFPRNLVDLYYETNRPGDGVGDKTLDEYHDRSWDLDDTPEMSEDKGYRKGPIPGKPQKVPFHSASKRIVASYLSVLSEKEYCSGPDIGVVIASYLIGVTPLELTFDLDNLKKAMLLEGLEKSEIDSKTKGLHTPDTSGVNVRVFRNSPREGRWTFKTHSGPRPAAAKEWPYTTTFEFIPQGKIRQVNKLHLRTSCTCPSWLWWGAQFNAKMNDYLYGPIIPKFTAPDIRDKSRKFLACKHILACIPYLKGTGQRGKISPEGFTLHMIDVPKEKRKRKMEVPKVKMTKKKEWAQEFKIPSEYLEIGRRPEIKSIADRWEMATPRQRKNMLKKLDDIREVYYFAHRFPESSTHFVADKIREIGDKTKKIDVKKEAEEKIKEVEKIEDKVEKILPDIPSELAHFEMNESVQNLIQDMKEASGWDRKKTLLDKQDDADALAYMATIFYRENFSEDFNVIIEKLKDLYRDKSDKKALKWSEYIY